MKHSFFTVPALLLCVSCNFAFASTKCESPDSLFPDAELKLMDVELKNGNQFIGKFELKNNAIKSALFIPENIVEKNQFINYPDVAVEFLDLNGQWRQLLNHPPGTFLSSTKMTKVVQNSKITFKASLFSKDMPGLSGTDFRLLLRLSKPNICIVSYPFRTLPVRPPTVNVETIKPGTGKL